MFSKYSDYDPDREKRYKEAVTLFGKAPINWSKINIVGAQPVMPAPFQYWNSPYTNNYIYPNINVNFYRPEDEVATNVNFKQFLDKTIKQNNTYAYGGEYLRNKKLIIFS